MILSDPLKGFICETVRHIFSDDIEIILFGSYAAGTAGPRSDIDIALKSKQYLDRAKFSHLEEVIEDSSLIQKVDVPDYHLIQPAFQSVIDKTGVSI